MSRRNKQLFISIIAICTLVVGGWVARLVFAAEVAIDSAVFDATDAFTADTIVFVSDTQGYAFYEDLATTLVYATTTDGGTTWGVPVAISTVNSVCCPDVWYDQWTPGDTTGRKIHITWIDATLDDIMYRYLDTSNDTFGAAAVTAIAPAAALNSTGVDMGPAITKATDNDVFIVSTIGAGGDELTASSTDNGVTWKTAAMKYQGVVWLNLDSELDLAPLANGNIMLAWNDGADLQYRNYTDSTTLWDTTDTVIDADFIKESTNVYAQPWALVSNATTSDVFAIGIPDPDSATAGLQEIRVYRYVTSFARQSNVATATPELVDAHMGIDANTGTLYAVYTRGGTAGITTDIFYKTSTNQGVSWGAEIQLNTTQDDLRHVSVNAWSNERLYVMWANDDTNVISGNTVVDLAPPSVPAVESKSPRVTISSGQFIIETGQVILQ